MQDGVRCHLGFLRYVNLAHSGVLVVWCLSCIPNLVLNIYYSHWDRLTYAPDIHLMTSRELTSGFEFWSRGHFRMAVTHLTAKFGAYIFIQSRVIDIFPKLKMAAAVTRKLSRGVVNLITYFICNRVYIFSVFFFPTGFRFPFFPFPFRPSLLSVSLHIRIPSVSISDQ